MTARDDIEVTRDDALRAWEWLKQFAMDHPDNINAAIALGLWTAAADDTGRLDWIEENLRRYANIRGDDGKATKAYAWVIVTAMPEMAIRDAVDLLQAHTQELAKKELN